ncbi:phage head morphogenesis protein [Paucibacter sp. TC2R-5]|uniref:phage head morphogenesis protein n=1 Tax=Paucibacter sp. TC2R-5 TaxID=2893555 RepID=UPI0021E3B5E0|nr:phage head morphogenesis protein [Paucibacter sp. TC2R-5]MCV2359641.1 phage head morphogenesis protein [Paucibacter sp. TC2R-5]
MPKAAASAEFGFGTPFAEGLAFFRAKLNLPTEVWDDIKTRAHDRAFIVAGAAKADLLQDLRGAVDAVIEKDGLHAFRQNFKAIVAKHGWSGWTGEGSVRGEAWRTKVIYQTNLSTSYAAGRYQQLTEPEFAKLRPFWKYVHSDSQLHPRHLHLAWHGLTLPIEHPFWKTHFAPNGWGCRCEIHPVAAPATGAATEPPAGWEQIDPKTGVQVGIDRGFDYAPGANVATPLQALIDQKLIKLDTPLADALRRAMAPTLAREAQAAEQALAVAANASSSAIRAKVAPSITPKSLDEIIAAGRTVTNALPDGAANPAACLQSLQDQLRRAGITGTACAVDGKGLGATLVKEASKLYPASWNAAADAMGPLKVRAKAGSRGFAWTADKDYPRIRDPFGSVRSILQGEGMMEVRTGDLGNAVHEYAHRLQAALPELDQLFRDLHARRTAGQPLKRLMDLKPEMRYKSNELTREDGYINPYQGKEYGPRGALEVMTMAFESVLGAAGGPSASWGKAERSFSQLWSADREMFDLVVGLLHHWKP